MRQVSLDRSVLQQRKAYIYRKLQDPDVAVVSSILNTTLSDRSPETRTAILAARKWLMQEFVPTAREMVRYESPSLRGVAFTEATYAAVVELLQDRHVA